MWKVHIQWKVNTLYQIYVWTLLLWNYKFFKHVIGRDLSDEYKTELATFIKPEISNWVIKYQKNTKKGTPEKYNNAEMRKTYHQCREI